MDSSHSNGTAIAPPWRHLAFFESTPVDGHSQPASSHELFQNPNTISVLSATPADILLADIYGRVHVIDKYFEVTKSWIAYNAGRATHMAYCRGVLVSIGEEEMSSTPVLKIWDMTKVEEETGAPLLLRSTKVQHNNRPHPVSSIALSGSMSHLAIGLGDGTVIIYRHLDQSVFSGSTSLGSLPKARILHESPTEPITGLGFREPSEEHPGLYLFVVTTNRVRCYQAAGKGSNGNPVVVDEQGAGLGCAVMDWHSRNMIVARDEAIYLYEPEERGPSIAYEGPKSSIYTHHNYLVIVSPPFLPSAATGSATVRNYIARTPQANATDVSKLTIFDLENKFVAYSGTYREGVRSIVLHCGQIYVLTNDGKLHHLDEKPSKVKLEMLYQKSWFPLALNLVKTQGLDESTISDVHRNYGDHLYSKGDYDGAMKQFIQTIGFLQPSYIIRKFLDAQRMHNLVTYLQELHSLGLANSDHTTLLLNIYTKLKDVTRLDSFIKAEARRSDSSIDKDDLPFDLETAIRVCRQAGYFEHASYLAKKYERHEDYLRIQVEDAANYKDALSYLRKLDAESTVSNLARYGRAMLSTLPDETTQLFIEICSGPAPTDSEKLTNSKASTNPSYLSYLALNRGGGAVSTAQDGSAPSTPTRMPTDGSHTNLQVESQDTPAVTTPIPASTISEKNSQSRKKPSPRLYFAHFVDRPDKFIVFLETVALRRWLQSIDSNDHRNSGAVGIIDDEDERADQIAVWTTLLELYLTLADKDGAKHDFEARAIKLLNSDNIPYDPTQALILCSTRNFTLGLMRLWEKMGMYEDILRFWMDKDKEGRTPDASSQVLHYLHLYGTQNRRLYPLALRFLTSSSALLSKHTGDLIRILEHIEQEKIMPPIGVIQVLSRNDVASIGLVKTWLLSRVRTSRDDVETNQQLIASYRQETRAKSQQVAELSNPDAPTVFHVTRCSACGSQLDLPAVHFMCNHSYHQRCIADNETECPNCARSYSMIREIRRNNEQLAGQHELFMSEVKVNGFNAVASGFGRGWMNMSRMTDMIL